MPIESAGEIVFQGGPSGPASALAIGTVTTGAPGSQAQAQVNGVAPNQTLDLTIPQGLIGSTGPAAWAPPVAWANGAVYTATAPRSVVIIGGSTYVCVAAHTATTFAADLAAGKWSLVAAQPWKTPPVAWAASTAYTTAAPADCVTAGGETYVCSTTHTSGASFDATKWTKIAQKGADGSPSAGAVLYNTAQSLAPADRRRARANIGASGAGYGANLTGAIALTTSNIGQTFYLNGTTNYIVDLPAMGAGDRITFFNANAIPKTIRNAASLYFGAGTAGIYTVKPYSKLVIEGYDDTTSGCFVLDAAPMESALNADIVQSFTPTQQAQLQSNLGITAAAVASGAPVQRAAAQTAVTSTTTIQTPISDTVPTTSNTTSVLSVSITPKATGNKLRVRAVLQSSLSVLGAIVAAIFQGAGANAIAANYASCFSGGGTTEVVVTAEVTAASTAAVSFALGVGSNNSGTLTVNGVGGGRVFGGVTITHLEVEEFAA